ncbi:MULTISPECIES: type II toxin-antitoxin system RelE/ParE family toxin [Flavobacterium]|uniref:type II toxin-antitoxin system RelE/ParE family toxin n=1 Tax=Flavobacterium TaxID=237 RepID=UPI001182C508|nr:MULTISPECIES: type II toxin-antitoxin system RelE/ParE family toxin [Flavobacterium]MCR4029978.1 type II toxin-antitoxin system RelE/ParE family toxin [Flavobacterium panacis]
MERVKKVIWTNSAKDELKAIYTFYKQKSTQGALSLKADILETVKSIVFAEQYQKDEIDPEYRKIIVRDYKILYKEINGEVFIVKIFSIRRFPERELE